MPSRTDWASIGSEAKVSVLRQVHASPKPSPAFLQEFNHFLTFFYIPPHWKNVTEIWFQNDILPSDIKQEWVNSIHNHCPGVTKRLQSRTIFSFGRKFIVTVQPNEAN